MYTSFHLNANELNEDFLKKIKVMFKSKRISITIEEEIDETAYLLSTPNNREKFEEAIKSQEGYAFTAAEFKEYSKALTKGKTLPVKKVKIK